MKLKRMIIISLLVLMALAMMPVQAQYITMANPAGIAERDILVYNSTGSLQGVYNSTSTIELNGSQDYIFSMKPLSTNPMEDPGDWLNSVAFPFITSNLIAIIVCCFLIGLVFARVL
jgi:hypothetical protein